MRITPTFNVADLYEYFPPDAALATIENLGSNSFMVRETYSGIVADTWAVTPLLE